jgi:lysophospholipase L1-like esterase
MSVTRPPPPSRAAAWLRAASVLFVAAVALAAPVAARSGDEARWIATWGASPQSTAAPVVLSGKTVRQIAHVSLGGDVVRVRLSNAFGTAGLPISEAHVAISAAGSSIVPGSDRQLTFGGSPTTVVPPGALVVSDPVRLRVAPLANLAISMYFSESVSATTEHSLAVQTTYLSATGNFANDATWPAGGSTTTAWYFVNGVEVRDEGRPSAAIVALGDSITDGYASTVSANRRWPNFLAARLQGRASTAHLAVVDEGISGNRVLHDFIGPNALARFDRDVLVQSGARWLVVLEGINDIGIPGAFGAPGEHVSADEIIEGHRQLIARAHAQGLRVYGGTLTPFEGTTFPGYFSPEGEAKRQAVNHWIRTSREYDGVIDFDLAVRDPSHPARILPAYDCGDHLHPNDAGYQAMANAIDLRLFTGDGK